MRYGDAENLCPPNPDNTASQPMGGEDEREIVALSDTEVADLLKAVGTSRIEAVTWELLSSILVCARHFITATTKAADPQLRTKEFKAWKKVGLSEVATKRYAYDVGGSTIYSMSLLSLACK